MVLSTALFEKPAFKSLVCNGLILAEDGKKMSKRLRNYPVSPLHMLLWQASTTNCCSYFRLVSEHLPVERCLCCVELCVHMLACLDECVGQHTVCVGLL